MCLCECEIERGKGKKAERSSTDYLVSSQSMIFFFMIPISHVSGILDAGTYYV